MPTKYLLEPITLGPVTLKNRTFMSAMTRSRSVPTNIPNDLNVEYYRQRSGAGLIVTEGTLVAQQGSQWPNAPGIWNKEQVTAWKKVTEAVHAEGSVIYVQLWHLGRASHPDMPEQVASGTPVYAPSAIAAQGGKFRQLPGEPGYVTPTEIENPEILIGLFKAAAINAKEAGFDGVEHGASGYLIHQFLDSTSNVRTDKWGGSVENRSRFGLEVLKTLVEVWGPGKVALKLSPTGGYNDVGMPLKETLETFKYFISEADKLDLSYILLVRHSYYADPNNRGTPHDVYDSYRHLVKNSKAFFNCEFTVEEAEEWVQKGKADGIFFGRHFLSHPDLVKRLQHGKPLDNPLDYATLYGYGGDEASEVKGYTDYPAADY
ncbi:hypothetical protein C8J56DRAFT_826910, partial [Mycena floridula]